MNARYYNPSIGRFLTQDAAGGDGWTNNLYSYCGNIPVSFIDPTGYRKEEGMGGGYHYSGTPKPDQIVTNPKPLECPWLNPSTTKRILKATEWLHNKEGSENKTKPRGPSEPKGREIIADDEHGNPVAVNPNQPTTSHIMQFLSYGDKNEFLNISPGLHNYQANDLRDWMSWRSDNFMAIKPDITKDVPWWVPTENDKRMKQVNASTEYAVFAWNDDDALAYGRVYYGIYDNGIEVILPEYLNGAAPPRIYNGGWEVQGALIPKGYY